MGLNVPALRVLAYAISSFLGGVGGAIFVAIAQSIYPSSFTVNDSVNFMLNCFLGGLGYVFGPMLGTLVLYFGWDLLFQTGQYQLLIYSGVMILLMLLLPNGLLACACPRGAGAEPMAPILQVKDLDQALRRPYRRQRRLVRRRAERNPVGHRPQRRRQVDDLQADLLLREADARRGDVQGRSDFRPRAAHRRAQGRGAHLSGDHDLQGHDGARQRHRRPPSALAREPRSASISAPRRRGATRRNSAGRATRSSTFSASARSRTRSPATCRRAICARSASPSASPPTRRSCCSTSPSPA